MSRTLRLGLTLSMSSSLVCCAPRDEVGQIQALMELGKKSSPISFAQVRLADGKTILTRLRSPRNCFVRSAIVIRNKSFWSGDGVRVCNFQNGEVNNFAKSVKANQECRTVCKLPESIEPFRLRLKDIARVCGVPDMDFWTEPRYAQSFQVDHERTSGRFATTWAEQRENDKQARYVAAFPCIQRLARRQGISVKYPITVFIADVGLGSRMVRYS
jgi:hypothetical protein